jgi:hypothetical protein
MKIKATGTKVLVRRTDDHNLIERERQVLPDLLQTKGFLGSVEDIGGHVEVDLEEGQFVILNANAGIPVQSWETQDHFRLVDQSAVYGIMQMGEDRNLFELINKNNNDDEQEDE